MVDLDTREWLLTNGLGSFASGTVSDVRTRTYHGWLFAATSPPSGRTLLLSHLEASIELPGRVVALGTNFWGSGQIEPIGYQLLRCFDISPVPKWIWGEDDWQLTRRVVMPYGLLGKAANYDAKTLIGGLLRANIRPNVASLRSKLRRVPPFPQSVGWEDVENFDAGSATRSLIELWEPQVKRGDQSSSFCHSILIQYRYEGRDAATLRLRLLICDRDFHHQQKEIPELQFSQLLGQQQVCLQAIISRSFGIPWYLRWTQGTYQPDGVWYWNYRLPEETLRGLGDREDLYSPGYLTCTLQPGDAVTLEARVGFPNGRQSTLTSQTFAKVVEAEQQRLSQIFGWGLGRFGRHCVAGVLPSKPRGDP